MHQNNTPSSPLTPEAYTDLLMQYGVSSVINIIVSSVTGWLWRCDLSVPRRELDNRLENPDNNMLKWLEQDNPYSKKAIVTYAAGMYKQRLHNLLESTVSQQRNVSKEYKDINSRELDEISNKIRDHTLSLSFDDGLNFLVRLTADWMLKCSAEIIREHASFLNDSWADKVNADQELSMLIMKWLVMSFSI